MGAKFTSHSITVYGFVREERKPLILRGARQVGKTTVIRKFAKTFSQFIYLNLEKRRSSGGIDIAVHR
ncbi:MAG: AAA family ATPase [Spirochaetia bacterium]|nr:AAA family ATPase [Spirochaetia bacterium]